MGYEQDFKYKDALKSLFDAAKTVSENVFTNDRPAAVPKQMDNFIARLVVFHDLWQRIWKYPYLLHH